MMTIDQLRTASDRVSYEASMLYHALQGHTRGKVGGTIPIDVVKNALLESFLIHARNLHAFLYGERTKRPTDVVAVAFFLTDKEQSAWIAGRPPEPPLFARKDETFDGRTLIERIHKRLAHITLDRVNFDRPKWPLAEITYELFDGLHAFGCAVPREHVSDGFRHTIEVMGEVFKPGGVYGHTIPGERSLPTSSQVEEKLLLGLRLMGKLPPGPLITQSTPPTSPES